MEGGGREGKGVEGKRGEERGSAVDHTASISEPLKSPQLSQYKHTNYYTVSI